VGLRNRKGFERKRNKVHYTQNRQKGLRNRASTAFTVLVLKKVLRKKAAPGKKKEKKRLQILTPHEREKTFIREDGV